MEVDSRVTVLVPVLNRPGHVAPLAESFRNSDTPGQLLFIVNESDQPEIDALIAAWVPFLRVPDDRVTWPQKINDGFRHVAEHDLSDWVLCGADDIRFHKGWFQATERLRETYGVIGTNDLGNKRVTDGHHTTHPLVSIEYAKRGTLTEPNAIAHEGYQHWYVDDELVTTAKKRGQWAFCMNSVVEHLHPYWNKAEWDETYQRGEMSSQADREEWIRRREIILRS